MVAIDPTAQDIIKTETIEHKSGDTKLEYSKNGEINFKKNVYNPCFPPVFYEISGYIVPGEIANGSITPRAFIQLRYNNTVHTFILRKENQNPIEKIINMDYKQADKIFKDISKQKEDFTNKTFGDSTIEKIKKLLFSRQR